jgi:hypothetical protein
VAVPCTAPFTGAVLDWAGNGIAASKSVAARERTKRIAILLGKRPGQSGALAQQLKNARRKQFLDPLSPRSTVVNGSHLTGLEREPQAAEGDDHYLPRPVPPTCRQSMGPKCRRNFLYRPRRPAAVSREPHDSDMFGGPRCEDVTIANSATQRPGWPALGHDGCRGRSAHHL